MSYPCAKVGGRRTNRVPCSGVHAGSGPHEARRTSCKYSIGSVAMFMQAWDHMGIYILVVP